MKILLNLTNPANRANPANLIIYDVLSFLQMSSMAVGFNCLAM
jgi:hypothetical protein